MKYGTVTIPNDYAYVLPISDCHIGDKAFMGEGCNKLEENIEWVKNEPWARVFLNGDILNVATRGSQSSPFAQNMDVKEQIDFAIKLFSPIKEKIVGAISGNHEQRIEDFCGYPPLTALCYALDIPYYQYSAVINFLVGKSTRGGRGNKISYTIYFHHTIGGGATPGGKMNRVDALRKLVCNCSAYVGSHNHQLGVIPVTTREVDNIHHKILILRQLLIDSGGYLGWDEGYSEEKMLPPTKIGSPRIRLNGKKFDIHCSI